jgi:hypothetical protein
MARPICAVAAISVIAVILCRPSLAAQPNPASGGDSELKQNFAAEHEVGRRFQFDPADLPAPKSGPIVTDRSLIVPYSEQTLQVPEGFVAAPYVTGLANPRRMLVLSNGGQELYHSCLQRRRSTAPQLVPEPRRQPRGRGSSRAEDVRGEGANSYGRRTRTPVGKGAQVLATICGLRKEDRAPDPCGPSGACRVALIRPAGAMAWRSQAPHVEAFC